MNKLRPGNPSEYVLKTGAVEARDIEGGRLLTIHYGADEEKGAEWAAETSQGVPHQVWQREMEGRVRVFDGVPVFPEYDSAVHEVDSIEIPARNRVGWLLGGWDCGNTLTPAFVVCHVTPWPHQIQFLFEVEVPDEQAMHMSVFAPYVRSKMREVWPAFDAYTIEHVGDPSGSARLGGDGRSAIDVAGDFGFYIVPSSNNPDERLGAVTKGLLDWIEEGETPRVVYSRSGCPTLCKGMGGGYVVKATRVSDGSRILEKPLKNRFSHGNDAHQYVMMRAMQLIGGKGNLGVIDRIGASRRPRDRKAPPVRFV